MSKDLSGAGPALEQLREVIAILRELANAGPRDNSFKQWRQVTLTLLQRMWPGDQTRAVRFRRIPFSPPSSRADTKTAREAYVRGVNEALAYLESLALELDPGRRQLQRPPEAPVRSESESDPSPGRRKLVLPPAAPVRPEPAPEPVPEVASGSDHERFMAPRPASPQAAVGPIEPSPWEAQGPSSPRATDGAEPPPPAPVQAAAPESTAAPASTGPATKGPRARLKDMLGFGDASDAPVDDVESQSRMPGATPRPPAPPVAAPQAAAAPAPPLPPASAPQAADAPVPAPPAPAAPAPPVAAASPPPETVQENRRLAPRPAPLPAAAPELTGRPAEPPPATLREMLDRQITPPPAPPMRASRDVRAMAAAVEQLGVPRERQEIVRAALLDLALQMDAPQAQWAALRQGMSFLMEYPPIARRVIPMLLPYLDEAA